MMQFLGVRTHSVGRSGRIAVIDFLAYPENNASRKVVESMGVPKKLIDELMPELIAERDKTVEEWSKEFTKNFADVKDIALGDKVGEDI